MAKVETNLVTLLYQKETEHGKRVNDYGGTDDTWTRTEPNEIGTFAADVSTVAREPISNKLQRQKGAISDLAASVEFGADATVSALLEWLPPVCFTEWQNADHRNNQVNSVVGDGGTTGTFEQGTDNVYTLEENNSIAYAASSLFWCRGFKDGANNGLRVLGAAASDSAKVLAFNAGGVTGRGYGTTVSTDADGIGTVDFAGYQLDVAATTAWAWNATSKRATLTTSAAHIAAMKQVLKKGQFVHFGAVATKGSNTVINPIQRGGTVGAGKNDGSADQAEMWGWARYTGEETTTTLVFDRVSETMQMSGNTGGSSDVVKQSTEISIIYCDFLKNVDTTDDLYNDTAYTLALVSDGLWNEAGTEDGVEYALGSKIGPLAISLALNDKATFTASFVSQDITVPVQVTGTNTDTKDEEFNAAVSTVADIGRLRMDTDSDGIDTDFKSLTLTLDPQVSPENVLGKLGAKYINRGNMLATVEAEVIFASKLIPEAIRNNATASFDFALVNEDGGIIFDIPSMTVGGGGRSYPVNAAVTITGSGESFEDSAHDSSIMVSMVPVPIPAADC